MSARLEVRVVPGAPRDEVEGEMADGRIKIRLRARAVEEAANRSLVEFVAERLRLPKRAVTLAAGAHSRQKTLEIEGMDAARARGRLLGETDAE